MCSPDVSHSFTMELSARKQVLNMPGVGVSSSLITPAICSAEVMISVATWLYSVTPEVIRLPGPLMVRLCFCKE